MLRISTPLNSDVMPINKMTISFHAKHVTYDEAIGGDLVQVCFLEDNVTDYGEEKLMGGSSALKCFLISMLYEFPAETPSIEWNDGTEENGGANINRITMSKSCLRVWLDNGLDFVIDFDENKKRDENIRRFFARLYGL